MSVGVIFFLLSLSFQRGLVSTQLCDYIRISFFFLFSISVMPMLCTELYNEDFSLSFHYSVLIQFSILNLMKNVGAISMKLKYCVYVWCVAVVVGYATAWKN